MKTFLRILFFFFIVTQICFAQWVQVGLNDKSIKDIAAQNSTIFAVTADSGRMYRSLDNGSSWTIVFESFVADVVISPTGRVLMVSDSTFDYWLNGDLHYSLDNGETWLWVEQLVDLISGVHPCRITVSPGGIVFLGLEQFIDTYCSFLAKSTDDGSTWTTPGESVMGGNLFDFSDQFIITNGYREGFGSIDNRIYLSSDCGNTWNFKGYPPVYHPNLLGLFSNNNVIIGGGNEDREIYISTDMCITWERIATFETNVDPHWSKKVGLHWSSGLLEGMLLGTENLGVFLFSDEGDSLGSWNEGLTNLNIQTLTPDNNGYVYAGTENGVWRRPLSDVTAAEENQIPIPSSFNLSQNYPNPFNPSSSIRWQSPIGSHQTLKIFDILGNEIVTLVNEYKSAGKYEIEFDASSLPSGVYFYQLRAGEFISTKKMILLK